MASGEEESGPLVVKAPLASRGGTRARPGGSAMQIRRTVALALALGALLLGLLPGPAHPRPSSPPPGAAQPTLRVELLKSQKGLTNSPTHDLYEFTLRVTNQGATPVQFTNNSFVLEDDAGARHRVSRPWYRQALALQPGQSTTVDRLYFEIPKTAKPRTLALVAGRQVLGRVDL